MLGRRDKYVNVCDTVKLLGGILQCNSEKFLIFCELLSNNSLFVGQLYEDKSLVLRAGDLIFFTTDLQTVNYYTAIHY